jgi:hypothetical protein
MNEKTLLTLVLMLPGLLFGAVLGITVGANNELILTGSNCPDLLNEQTALCSWKKNLDPGFTPHKLANCEKLKSGHFKISILECLPEQALAIQKKKLMHDGPNCWGTAMSFKKLAPTPRFFWPEEMLYWMQSPLCRKLSPGEKIQPGDIINVFAPEKLDRDERQVTDAGTKFWELHYPNRTTAVSENLESSYTGFHRLLHTVTYVSENLAFGKDSPSKSDPFYFHALEEVYGRPRKDEPDCQENQSIEPYLREYQNEPREIRGSKCSYFSQAYRCEDFLRYFKKQNISSENLAFLAKIEALQEIQRKIFKQLFTSSEILESSEIKNSLMISDLAVSTSSAELKNLNIDKTTESLIVLEYFTAAGIRQTLEQFTGIKPSAQ